MKNDVNATPDPIEVVQSLLDCVYLEGAERTRSLPLKIQGARNRAPSKSVFIGHGFEVMPESLGLDFLKLVCKTDEAGNLIFKGTARNFNPNMCGAAKITVAEVEELVPVGALDPNEIHVPGIFVQRIFQGAHYEKRIEQRTTRTR